MAVEWSVNSKPGWILLSAFKDSSGAPREGTGSATESEWTSSSSARVREILSRTEDEVRRQGIDCTTRADAGHPAEVLVQLAAECEADLLVIGNKGMERRVLGSVPNTVNDKAPCSVLVVKDDLSPALARKWTRVARRGAASRARTAADPADHHPGRRSSPWKWRSRSQAVALLGNRAARHPPKEEEDEDHADQRTEDAAPIEYVLIADPEDAGEDEPAHRGSDQAQHDRDQPGLWPFQVLEYVVGGRSARPMNPATNPNSSAPINSTHPMKMILPTPRAAADPRTLLATVPSCWKRGGDPDPAFTAPPSSRSGPGQALIPITR